MYAIIYFLIVSEVDTGRYFIQKLIIRVKKRVEEKTTTPRAAFSHTSN